MITLREIGNYEMFDECVGLQIKEGQKLYSNAYSLAEAWLNCKIKEVGLIPFCIYNDDTMVGFVMLIYDEDEKELGIYRFMIDEKYQGMGYGKEAMKAVLEYIYNNPFFNNYSIGLDVHPNNEIAIKLYRSVGFVASGIDDETGELEMELKRTE